MIVKPFCRCHVFLDRLKDPAALDLCEWTRTLGNGQCIILYMMVSLQTKSVQIYPEIKWKLIKYYQSLCNDVYTPVCVLSIRFFSKFTQEVIFTHFVATNVHIYKIMRVYKSSAIHYLCQWPIIFVKVVEEAVANSSWEAGYTNLSQG